MLRHQLLKAIPLDAIYEQVFWFSPFEPLTHAVTVFPLHLKATRCSVVLPPLLLLMEAVVTLLGVSLYIERCR